jgi:hypothetical protein
MKMRLLGKTLCVMLIATAPVGAQAACSDGQINASVLSDKLVCAYKPGSGGTDPNRRWSEIHNTATDGGAAVTLGEHGRGTTDPAGSYDADIGSWSYAGETVIYTYTHDSGSPYTLTLHGTAADTPTSLCDGGNESAVIHTVISIPADTATNPCGW